jgi:hypothetical protein
VIRGKRCASGVEFPRKAGAAELGREVAGVVEEEN